MAIWSSKKDDGGACYVVVGGRIPKGYVPMVLVGDEDDGGGEETTVAVRVGALREPCMAALLQMAEEQFGYGQRGVLRIPCGARRFEQMVRRGRRVAAQDQRVQCAAQ